MIAGPRVDESCEAASVMGGHGRGGKSWVSCSFYAVAHNCPPPARSFSNVIAMWSSIGASMVVVNLIATAAAHGRGGWDWVSGLPSCWGHCLDDNGCNSKQCQSFQVLDIPSDSLMWYQVSAKQARMMTTSRVALNAWYGRATPTG